MPYTLKGNCVVKADSGETVPGGCHDTHAEAVKHLGALMANVKDAVQPVTTDTLVVEVSKREDVNPDEGTNQYGDVSFADAKNKKYPIDTEEHIRAAWNYINKGENAGKYSSEDAASIKGKIVTAWKNKIDKTGPPSAESAAVNSNVRENRKLKTTYLTEAAVFDGGKIGEHTFPVTLIRPGWSANGRYYSRETIAKAADKFDGAKAYADHPSKSEEKDRPERSVKDITGYYTDVKQSDDGALKGNLHIVGAAREWLVPLVQETITTKPDLIGLSINALGKTSMGEAEGKKGIIVEDIVKGNSTDIVTTPAAGGRFESLRMAGDDFTQDLINALDFEEWREARPEFIQRLREEMKTLRQDEAVQTANAQVTQLQETIAAKDGRIRELEEAQRAKEKELSDERATHAQRERSFYADKLIAESKLPKAWTSALRPQLFTESNTGNWPAVISAEHAKYLAVARPVVKNAGVGWDGADSQRSPISEALGVHLVPGPFETPEQFARRKAQNTNRGAS